MWLYDALASFRNVERHRWLSKRSLLRAEPRLRAEGLLGGARYFDAQCDDARLTLANARDAHRHGALVATYTEARGFDVAAGRIRAVRLADRMTGDEFLVRASVVVNASGPWSDEVRGDGERLLLLTKGAQRRGAADPPRAVPRGHPAVAARWPGDVRASVGDLSYVGTTETPFEGSPETVTATADDVVYLLRSANAVFPDARLQPDDVVATWAGVRPLVRPRNGRSVGAVSREHVVTERPA